MMRCLSILTLGILLSFPLSLHAETTGDEDIVKAVDKQLSAENMADLEEVLRLCNSALAKGLDPDMAQMAHQMAASTHYRRAEVISRSIFRPGKPDPRWSVFRKLALRDLNKALEHEKNWGAVHLMVARLESLPGGDDKKAKEEADKAVTLLVEGDDKAIYSEALTFRATLLKDSKKKLADIDKAIEANEKNIKARRLRGLYYHDEQKYKEAVADFEAILVHKEDDLLTRMLCAQSLMGMEKLDEAMEHIEKVLAAEEDNHTAHEIKGRILFVKGKLKEAEKSLDRAINLNPSNIRALLTRQRLLEQQERYDEALGDVNRVLQLVPELTSARIDRSIIYAQQDKMDLAIAEIKSLLNKEPDYIPLKIQLANYYAIDHQFKKAMEVYGSILKADPKNIDAIRSRGDLYLRQGKHRQAIADLERVVKLQPEDTPSLNNLAWLLATSTSDKLRDGKRAITLALKAAELTEYKQAHIISTLAAAYAESGNFEKAREWVTKALAQCEDKETKEAVTKELDSYKKHTPWRERIEEKEKSPPPPARMDDLKLK